LGPPGQESATKGVQKILDFGLSFPSWSFLQHVVNADEWGKFDLYCTLASLMYSFEKKKCDTLNEEAKHVNEVSSAMVAFWSGVQLEADSEGFVTHLLQNCFFVDDVWKEWVLEGRQLWASSQPWLWRPLAIPSSEFKSCSNFPLLPPMPIMGCNAWLWDDILMCCHPMSPKSGYV
jgi:hypothetical protein